MYKRARKEIVNNKKSENKWCGISSESPSQTAAVGSPLFYISHFYQVDRDVQKIKKKLRTPPLREGLPILPLFGVSRSKSGKGRFYGSRGRLAVIFSR